MKLGMKSEGKERKERKTKSWKILSHFAGEKGSARAIMMTWLKIWITRPAWWLIFAIFLIPLWGWLEKKQASTTLLICQPHIKHERFLNPLLLLFSMNIKFSQHMKTDRRSLCATPHTCTVRGNVRKHNRPLLVLPPDFYLKKFVLFFLRNFSSKRKFVLLSKREIFLNIIIV